MRCSVYDHHDQQHQYYDHNISVRGGGRDGDGRGRRQKDTVLLFVPPLVQDLTFTLLIDFSSVSSLAQCHYNQGSYDVYNDYNVRRGTRIGQGTGEGETHTNLDYSVHSTPWIVMLPCLLAVSVLFFAQWHDDYCCNHNHNNAYNVRRKTRSVGGGKKTHGPRREVLR